MPQILLYGGAVILIGVLQSHRRFLGPAIGPLVSSVVVISAYVVFGSVAHHRETALSTLSSGRLALTRPHELILSVGTTLGVAALLVAVVVPATRSGLSIRPTYRFPAGVGGTIRAMAIAGALVVGSQDLATGGRAAAVQRSRRRWCGRAVRPGLDGVHRAVGRRSRFRWRPARFPG